MKGGYDKEGEKIVFQQVSTNEKQCNMHYEVEVKKEKSNNKKNLCQKVEREEEW